MLYVIENNGVYGLTKGQFSASADIGTKSKRGEANQYSPIDPVSLALELGASFVARAFSGDKGQLVPILKAGLSHKGFALIDVISPCVTFNDHEGSTKSYLNTRKKMLPIVSADFVPPPPPEITTEYAPGSAVSVQLHDGSTVRLRKLAEDYDTGNRQAAADEVERHRCQGRGPHRACSSSTPSRATCTTSAAPPTSRCRSSPTRSSAPAAPPSTSCRSRFGYGTLRGLPWPPATTPPGKARLRRTRIRSRSMSPPRADSYCSCITTRPEMFMAVTVAR